VFVARYPGVATSGDGENRTPDRLVPAVATWDVQRRGFTCNNGPHIGVQNIPPEPAHPGSTFVDFLDHDGVPIRATITPITTEVSEWVL
jgi:hypothetical protein